VVDLDDITPEQLAKLADHELIALRARLRWLDTARPKQLPPDGDWGEWGILAGRGFGKTRVGAEWLWWDVYTSAEEEPCAVIAPTQSDVRYTCFEGPAGLVNVIPPELVLDYNRSDLILTVRTQSGGSTTIRGFSAEKADRLRGPQHRAIWADEIAAWQNAQDAYDMAMFGLRLGSSPKFVWTSTPKATEMVRALVTKEAGRVITQGSTYDNRANLPAKFFQKITKYEGTALGRQEIDGELLDPEEAGIIKRSWFRLWPSKKHLPTFEWIIMSLDTAYTQRTIDKKTHEADFSACNVFGVFQFDDRRNVMLLDSWQEQLGLPQLIKRVKREMLNAYGDDQDVAVIKPLFGSGRMLTSGRKPDLLIVEDKGSGISLRQSLEAEGLDAYAYNPGNADKVSRLHIASLPFARRQVWLPESEKNPGKPKTWSDEAITQLCTFTGEGTIKHDDHVDSWTQALRVMMDKNMLADVKLSKQPVPVPDEPHTNPYGA
jgi:phage terminase large subunit-like protein